MSGSKLKHLLQRPAGSLNRAERRNAEKLVQKEKRRLANVQAAEAMSGAGYPVDAQLRKLVGMMNEEHLAGAEVAMRNLNDFLRPFVVEDDSGPLSFYRLRPERDHAFDGRDFFAFADAPEIRGNAVRCLLELTENVIHSFTVLGDVHDTRFEETDRDAVVLSGISMIRSGNLLYWQTAGGRIADLERLTVERRTLLAAQEAAMRQANPAMPERELQSLLRPSAGAFAGTADVWDCAAFGLFNLATQRHEMRALAKEWTVSQAVFTDHFEQIYADRYENDERIRRMVDKAVLQLEEDRLFFEVAETAFALPAYFAARVSFVHGTDVVTALGRPGSGQERKHALKAPPDARHLVRRVATLDLGARPDLTRSFTPPRYQVEVGGFFRRLSPGAVGRDSEGNAVRGMTWVRTHARRKDRPPKLGVVHVKSSVGGALARAEKLAGGVAPALSVS